MMSSAQWWGRFTAAMHSRTSNSSSCATQKLRAALLGSYVDMSAPSDGWVAIAGQREVEVQVAERGEMPRRYSSTRHGNSTKPGRFTMRTRPCSEVINEDRRQLLSTAAIGIAAAGAASLFPAYPAPAARSDAIRPFRINVPEDDLVDLRRRIAATKWPEKETVTDQSQGVQLATIQELARYWATDYDWRKAEARLNALPAVHHRHRWAGHSFHSRSLKASKCYAAHRHARVARLDHRAAEDHRSTANPTAHGGRAEDAFDVVIPSMPGYGFSGKPTSPAGAPSAWPMPGRS